MDKEKNMKEIRRKLADIAVKNLGFRGMIYFTDIIECLYSQRHEIERNDGYKKNEWNKKPK